MQVSIRELKAHLSQYLTSALFKLHVEEAHGDRLESRVGEADAVAVCRIAWAEA